MKIYANNIIHRHILCDEYNFNKEIVEISEKTYKHIVTYFGNFLRNYPKDLFSDYLKIIDLVKKEIEYWNLCFRKK